MSRRKILIIDDDADIRQLLHLRLKPSYDTAFAADAVSALTITKRESPDLILLDIGLPGGDGFLIMDRLRAIPALSVIPVIVLSAQTTGEERSLTAGAHAFFTKPFDNEELLASIREALGEAAA